MTTSTTIRINSELITHRGRRDRTVRSHKLPLCETTGLARYRDRHQALQGARAISAGTHNFKVATFACPDCFGIHLEKMFPKELITVGTASEPVEAFTASLPSRKRRYVLFDVENPTRGAKATCEELAGFWNILKQQAPGIAPRDHVVVGAARSVARTYRAAIQGANVTWVIGANTADGADHALLSAIDLRRVARDYDELVIISGDHAFTDLARRAKLLGLSVHVVTAEHPEQRSMLSRELSAVADTHTRVRLHPRTPRHANITPITTASRRVHLATTAA